MSKIDMFADVARGMGGSWVTYESDLKNPHSAASLANQMRKRFPDLEIKSSKGVITARVREVTE